jgi:protein-arginine kinase activator protein McsA
MAELVKQEAFEQAAVIRDKIKKIEHKFETGEHGT